MAITIEGMMLLISWIILGIGVGLLISIPTLIYHYIKSKGLSEIKTRDRKLKDRQMLLDYYITAGITITIIGFLLILIFSGKLTLP